MIKRMFLFLLISISISNFAYANEYTDLIAYKKLLQQQIEALDTEIIKCEKSTKGWKTATIVGGVAAVASGIGILAQHSQIKENNNTLQHNIKDAQKADFQAEVIQKVME